MSSFGASASASSSLPQNLGVGYTAAAVQTNGKFVSLSEKDNMALNAQLTTVRKLYSTTIPPTTNELKSLSEYITLLITDPSKDNVVEALKGMIKSGTITTEQAGINSLALLVAKLKKDSVEVALVEKKLTGQLKLEYSECFLIDALSALSEFAEKIVAGGIKDNPHINRLLTIHHIAEENAFREFQDGDVLFYDRAASLQYGGSSVGFFDWITISSLGTNYTHVGVFYRDSKGRPCVAQIQGQYYRDRLTFGQQTFIKAKRVDPAKFTATQLTAAERLEAQKKIGDIFADIIAGNDWKIGITFGQQVNCVMSHKTSAADTLLGRVKVQGGKDVNMLCSELAGKGLMEAFDKFNKDKPKIGVAQKVITLSNPFDPHEDMATLHPERLLVGFGPDQGTAKADSGWNDVVPLPAGTNFLPLDKMLPAAARFPEASYPKAPPVPASPPAAAKAA